MNLEEFREEGKKLIDYICEYRHNLPEQRVIPGADIKANELKKVLSDKIPIDGEHFEEILREFKEKVVPRLAHWGHPNFAAYFPSGSSFPAILGDMLSSGTNQLGFSWRSSPAMTEHEQLTLNMYAKALDLPKCFVYDDQVEETGGGALQGGASECIFLALLAARHRAVQLLKGNHKSLHDSLFLPYMVAYTSEEAHSCVQKAAKIAIIRLRVLPTDEHGVLHGETLAKAIEHDVNVEGFTPIFVSATVGTTGTCAFDNLESIGKVCKKYPTIWYHVDGAYAGNSFLLPEMRPFKRGLEYADSFNTNPNKLLLTTFDCSCFWVRHISQLKEAMAVNPTYLEKDGDEGEDLRHFGIALSRRFRSLKLWCVLRNYGIRGLQSFIRNHIAMAKHMEALLRTDNRFVIVNDVYLGLVCFKIIVPGSASNSVHDTVNIEFLQRINASGDLHMVPTKFHGNLVIRYCITNEKQTTQNIEDNFRSIQKHAASTLDDYAMNNLQFQKRGSSAFHPRFSFTRSVSHEEHLAMGQGKHLKDGAEAICLCDICEEEADDVFAHSK